MEGYYPNGIPNQGRLTSEEAIANLSIALGEIENKEIDEQIEIIDQLLTLVPYSARLWIVRSELATQIGDEVE